MLKNHEKVLNLAALVLVVALVAMQFLPFWSYKVTEKVDGQEVTITETASIAKYVWMPYECRDLTEDFGEALDDAKPMVTHFITEAALVLALGIVSVVMGIVKRNNPMVVLFPLAVGVIGCIQFLGQKVMQMGNLWQAHLAVSIVLTVVSLASVVLTIVKKVKK